MQERLQPTLALLDQGLQLYRRHFVSFVLIAAAWFVPVAVLVGLGIALGSRIDEWLAVLLALVGAIVFFVLMIYLLIILSRAAATVIRDQPLRLAELLRFEPLRMVGMTMYTIVYLIVSQILASFVSLICICPAYIFGFALATGASAIGGEVGGLSGVLLLLLLSAVLYLVSFFISGAVYSGMVYGLQPWAQEHGSFGTALQHSIDLMFYRFWRNISVWGTAALILAAVGLTVSMVIGIALPLPLAWTFGAETPAVQAVTVAAWLTGLILVLPPLPIWMAMLYRNNHMAREGADLQVQVDAWWQQHFAAVPSEA